MTPVRTFLRNCIRDIMNPSLGSVFLRYKAKSCVSTSEYVNLTFNIFNDFPWSYFDWGIKPLQVKEEIIALLELVQSRRPKTVLEIGTASGGTLFLWSKVSRTDATIISLDLPGETIGCGYSKKRIPYYKSFATHQQQIKLIRGNSHNSITASEVERTLGETFADFIFIDGDHSYEGVKQDFNIYSRFIAKNGILAFHDICHHVKNQDCQVDKLWNEIKHNYQYREIIYDQNQGWAGIGVLFF